MYIKVPRRLGVVLRRLKAPHRSHRREGSQGGRSLAGPTFPVVNGPLFFLITQICKEVDFDYVDIFT